MMKVHMRYASASYQWACDGKSRLVSRTLLKVVGGRQVSVAPCSIVYHVAVQSCALHFYVTIRDEAKTSSIGSIDPDTPTAHQKCTQLSPRPTRTWRSTLPADLAQSISQEHRVPTETLSAVIYIQRVGQPKFDFMTLHAKIGNCVVMGSGHDRYRCRVKPSGARGSRLRQLVSGFYELNLADHQDSTNANAYGVIYLLFTCYL